jgi:hypothetical protein
LVEHRHGPQRKSTIAASASSDAEFVALTMQNRPDALASGRARKSGDDPMGDPWTSCELLLGEARESGRANKKVHDR